MRNLKEMKKDCKNYFKTKAPIFHDVTAILRSCRGFAIKFKSCALQEEEQTFIHLELFNNLHICKSMIL